MENPIFAFFDTLPKYIQYTTHSSCDLAMKLIELAHLRTDRPIDRKGDVVLAAAVVVVVAAFHVEILFALGGIDFLGNAAGKETCHRIGRSVNFLLLYQSL